jgi:hypothetical protein
VGSFHGPLPAEPPEVRSSNVALYAGCGQTFERGFFHLRDMNVPNQQPTPIAPFKPIPEDASELDQAMQEVSFIVYDPKCGGAVLPPARDFIKAADYHGEQLWVRRWR